MIPFVKMHGTGNDFVIIDCRTESYPPIDYTHIADRRKGIGCDQVILIHPSNIATCKMDIYNVDGSKAEMCGNAARCVLRLVTSELQTSGSIELANRVISGERLSERVVKINMGKPLCNWDDIPLREACDTCYVNFEMDSLKTPVATNIGNPHVTFFVEDINSVPFEKLAPKIENHPLFPNRVNVTIASVINDHEIKARIWERGVGITEACGSSSCATLMAAIRRGLIKSNRAVIQFPGGDLTSEFDGKHVFMTGEAVIVFNGIYRNEL